MAPTDSLEEPVDRGALAGRRIGVVGMHFAPETTGNAPYTTALAQSLEQAGAAVLVLTGVPHYPQWRVDPQYRRGLRWSEREGRKVLLRRRHWVPRNPDTVGRGLMEATFLAQTLTTLPGLKVDALIAVTPMLSSMVTCAAWSRISGTPWGALVQDLTGVGAQQSGVAGHSVSRAVAEMEYGLLRAAAVVGVVAPEFGQTLAEAGVEESRILHTPNFTHIEASSSTKAEARLALGWPVDRFLVVHTGNMGMKQGLETALDAADRNCDFDLVLVGTGSQRAELERRAKGTRNVHFVDPLPSDAYPLALAAADALLVVERSTAGQMSVPSKLTSYFAAGRPVVASTPLDGITARLMQAAAAGPVVPAGDPEALAQAVGSLKDASRCATAAESAQAYCRRHMSWDAAFYRYVNFADRILLSSN